MGAPSAKSDGASDEVLLDNMEADLQPLPESPSDLAGAPRRPLAPLVAAKSL